MSTGTEQNGTASQAEVEAFNSFKDMTNNAYSFQRRLERMFLDRRRNIAEECGYPETEELTAEVYRRMYDREPLAKKVVDIYSKGCWQVQPELFETEDKHNVTPFEEAWNNLGKTLHGPGFFEDQEGESNPIWEYLERADRLSGIGAYGAVFLGFDDGLDPIKPVVFQEGGATEITRRLMFIRPLDECVAEISTFESDHTSPRLGMPTEYSITLESPGDRRINAIQRSDKAVKVHWSRVIHLVDNLDSSEVFGASRMQVPYNRLYDLYKMYGGSAEMYWLAAFFGISFETHPQLGGQVTIDSEKLKEQLENYQNSLQRYLAMPGMTAKTLAPQVVDPTAQINVLIEAICILLNCPKRIFMGSERGELSSSQDARAWYGVLKHRQTRHVTPRIIVPFVDRLIQVGVLPSPESYSIKWPDIATVTETERADIAVKQVEAITKYAQGDGEAVMDLLDFYIRILGFSPKEAEAIIESRESTESLGEEEEPEEFGESNPFSQGPADPEEGINESETDSSQDKTIEEQV